MPIKEPSFRELREIRFWCSVLLVVLVLVELLHFGFFGVFRIVEIFSSGDRSHLPLQVAAQFSMAALFLWIAGWMPLSSLWKFGFLALGLVAAGYMATAGQVGSAPVLILYALSPMAIGLLVYAGLIAVQTRRAHSKCPGWVNAYFYVAILAMSLATLTTGMLKIGSVLFPLTYDFHLYKVDAAFFGLASKAAELSNTAPSWFRQITLQGYAMLGFLFFPLMAFLIREEKQQELNGWRTFFLPFAAAWLCYAWVPMSGPIYAFPDANFPANIPAPDSVQSGLAVIAPALRNGMPSMHLSGAILILMICIGIRRIFLIALASVFVLLTFWATLALGEHYFIDLVVAAPFAVAIGSLLIKPQITRSGVGRALVILCSTIFIFWMVAFKTNIGWLENSPISVQILSVLSFLSAFGLIWKYSVDIKFLHAHHSEKVVEEPAEYRANSIISLLVPAQIRGKSWLVGIFFFSGFAGLMYEVVYAKALGVTFGGTSLASYTVLATYMGGMALGAWIGGAWAERISHPLRAYAMLEALIGLYAVVTPFLFSAIQWLYVKVSLDHEPGSAWLTVLRVSLGAAVLGVPTIMMGATLPLVFKQLKNMGLKTESAIAPLYTANIIGAACGALATGYAILPALGRDRTTYVAALLSLLISLFVIEKLKKNLNFSEMEKHGRLENSVSSVSMSAYSGRTALVVLLVGGAVTLALEVVYMHMLAIVSGNSVYAFGLMLATFLFGLGVGSLIGERMIRYLSRPIVVVIAQCGVAIAIWATALMWDELAQYMGNFGYAQMAHGVHFDFVAREIIRAIVCAVAMLPPAVFIGMCYPATMGIATDWLGRQGKIARGLGLASGINTVGNILGVLIVGFILLPLLGSRNVMQGLGITALLLAFLMLVSVKNLQEIRSAGHKLAIAMFIAGVAAMGILFPSGWNMSVLSGGGNVYFYHQSWGEVIDHSESVEGGITSVTKRADGLLTLLTNGKFQGNNAEDGEMVAQESFALFPLLHTPHRGSALVIGYGTGMTTRVLHEQKFSQLDVAELSRDIVEMADKHFSNINAHISANSGVRMHYTDGRNFLLTQSRKYDLISLEISSIWFAGAANLYNREFYELANTRMHPDGVIQQWVQLHHMQPLDFLYILGSVRSVFKYVWVYKSGGQGIIIASNSDASFPSVRNMRKMSEIQPLSSLDVSLLPDGLLAGPERIDELLKKYDPSLSVLVSTDKNLYLEYSTPKGNAVQVDTTPLLVNMLRGAN